jgi:S-adenosylmethionine:tRNA ribosyltransferase-isomerase
VRVSLRVETFDYELQPSSIAQYPLAERDSARLLVLPAKGELGHCAVRDLPSVLPGGALIVLNDTRVVPARLLGRKTGSGGKAEILLLQRLDSGDEPLRQRWRAMGRASKGLSEGCSIECGDLRARVLGPSANGGLIDVELESRSAPLEQALARSGHTPLPPYIRRKDDTSDRERYQTVFARVDGAVAAPTAGLHFTHALLQRIRDAGCRITAVTLHVGLGTFQPVTAVDLDEHAMHEETFEVSPDAAGAIAEARRRSASVVAVGTTVMRALESAADPSRAGHVTATRAATRLLIQPGYHFRVVDRLLTNFHVPRSTLLALVCAFAGTARVLAAYRSAQVSGYRFLSYGDAMWLERADS